MALETVIFEQDPFIYGHKDCINCDVETYSGLFGQLQEETKPDIIAHDQDEQRIVDIAGGSDHHLNDCSAPPPQKRRRRSKSTKNEEEIENQRMTHIAVERNRRRQMNDYLATLRSMMPPSYARRGDQASIVGGAINYVKELEQHVHFLQARKSNHDNPHKEPHEANEDKVFSNGLPQYRPSNCPVTDAVDLAGERRSKVEDVEATMAESHANIKVVDKRRRPKQLVKMVAGFQSIGLTVLHLNVTTVADQSVLYSFSVKVEEGCQFTNANEIASAVHDMIEMIRRELSSVSI